MNYKIIAHSLLDQFIPLEVVINLIKCSTESSTQEYQFYSICNDNEVLLAPYHSELVPRDSLSSGMCSIIVTSKVTKQFVNYSLAVSFSFSVPRDIRISNSPSVDSETSDYKLRQISFYFSEFEAFSTMLNKVTKPNRICSVTI